MKHKTIFILSIGIGISAVALGIMAFRFARHEEEYRQAETNKLLRAECRVLADRCRDVIRRQQQNINMTLRDSLPVISNATTLQRKNPLIKQIFITDSKGVPLFPPNDNSFFRSYHTLFYENISSASNGGSNDDESPSLNQTRIQNKTFQKKSRRYQKAYIPSKQKRLPLKQELTSNQSKRQLKTNPRLLTRFALSIKDKSNGWIPWFSENRFCPLAWSRNIKQSGKIIGAEIETIALLSRLVAVFPQNLPDYYRIELTNAHGSEVYGTGFKGVTDNDSSLASPPVVIGIAPDLIPGWQIRGYLSPQFNKRSRSLVMINILQIGSLLMIILAASGILFLLVHRESVIASQKTTFVANVSHELKTPLTSIRMYSEMLLNSQDKLSSEKREHYLSVILSESERLSRLITNVLDFSRMEAGEKNITRVKSI